MTIWKFPFNIADLAIISMPIGARVIKVDSQREQPCIWAIVDPLADTELREFHVVGTGFHMPDCGAVTHIGTLQMHGGALVFHVFERASS